MPRPIAAHIHPSALRHNLNIARRHAGDAQVFAVVKANAYGHGIERVYDALRGADGFALLDIAEAQRLRALDWRGPILLLEGAFDARDLEWCSRLGLWHVVHHEAQIDWLAAHKTQQGQRVFLKMNSGMNRLGFTPDAFRAAWVRLDALPQVDEISLMTHFSDADRDMDGHSGADAQVSLFVTTTHDLPGERSLNNSAAILRLGESNDWVRAGIMLYGSAPDHPEHSAAHWDLRPTLSLRSRLIATQTLAVGHSVGYGSTFTAPEAMRIGVVACGYADGYPRHMPGLADRHGHAMIDGVRCPVVGRVSMDMMTVDLRPLDRVGKAVDVGHEVLLWGTCSQGHALPIDEVAHAAGTIGYELMCALAPRVPVLVDA